MPIFTTTQNLVYQRSLPSSVSRSAAVSLLHDHDFLIRLDPEFSHYDAVDTPPDASNNPKTRCYIVTDHMPTLPAGLWDTTVMFQSLITDLEDGIEWVIRAPMGATSKAFWRVVKVGAEEREDDDGDEQLVNGEAENALDKSRAGEEEEGRAGMEWALSTEVEINASRLLVGMMAKKYEGNIDGMQSKIVERLLAKEKA